MTPKNYISFVVAFKNWSRSTRTGNPEEKTPN